VARYQAIIEYDGADFLGFQRQRQQSKDEPAGSEGRSGRTRRQAFVAWSF
jgi:hypothetical protein